MSFMRMLKSEAVVNRIYWVKGLILRPVSSVQGGQSAADYKLLAVSTIWDALLSMGILHVSMRRRVSGGLDHEQKSKE